MAVTNGWGQAAINNTIGFGQGSTNATNGWGEIYEDSPSGDTAIEGASFTNVYSTEYDGVDDYVDCGTFAALNSATALTLSVWFKSSVYTTSGRLVNLEKHVEIYQSNASYGNTQGRFYYKLMGNYGNGFKTLGGTSASGVGNLCDGNWHHLCFVFDNSTTTSVVYEDGVAVITDASTTGTLNSASDTFYIGADPSGANAIEGNIDEVAVFNSALTPSEIAAIYNSGNPQSLDSYSPLGWWRMGDGDTYPTLTDNGSGGNNGTMTNMVSGDIVTDVPT